MAEQPWTIDATARELADALEALCDACERCADPTPTMERRVEIARALLAKAAPL